MSDLKKNKKKNPGKVRNLIILIVVVILIAAGAVYSAKNSNIGGKMKLKSYQETEEVTTGDILITVKATGNLEPYEKIDLRPEASGKIEKLLVDAGDIVEQGQVVAILDQSSQQNQLERAKASVNLAKANLEEVKKGYRSIDKASIEDTISVIELRLEDAEREFSMVKDLFEKNIASQDEYDKAKAYCDQLKTELEGYREKLNILLAGGEKEAIASANANYEIALANLKEAERLLGDAVVDAPMSGVVLERYVSEGSVVLSGLSTFSTGEAILSIGDVSKMKLIARVDEGDIGKVEIGQKTLIEVDAWPDEKFEGSVTKLAPQGIASGATMTTFGVTIEIDNSDNRLKSGFTADVEIIVDELKDVVRIPFRALLETDDITYCFVVDDNDMIEEREIKVGRTNYEHYEVIEGLASGEKVITKGRPSKLKGDKEESGSNIEVKIG